MAVSRFVELRAKETWNTVSGLFREWVVKNCPKEKFGWSEGDPIILQNGLSFACFRIPDHHGEKIEYFLRWVESTDRLYGIADGRLVTFARDPALNYLLPPPKQYPVPSWLK